jgi:hypothetical protein
MGYTHYWKFEPNKVQNTEQLRKKFKKASQQIKKFAEWLPNKGIEIRGGLGEGKPIFNETEVWFNGNQAEGLDHETFGMHWSRPNLLGNWSDFCKTARKPYDLLVCFALLTFAHIFPKEVFDFSSDGTMEDTEWQHAVEYYETFTGKTAKVPTDLKVAA